MSLEVCMTPLVNVFSVLYEESGSYQGYLPHNGAMVPLSPQGALPKPLAFNHFFLSLLQCILVQIGMHYYYNFLITPVMAVSFAKF
jgi:hypothetical protein